MREKFVFVLFHSSWNLDIAVAPPSVRGRLEVNRLNNLIITSLYRAGKIVSSLIVQLYTGFRKALKRLGKGRVRVGYRRLARLYRARLGKGRKEGKRRKGKEKERKASYLFSYLLFLFSLFI